jgi:hypothetical protein
MSTQFSLNTSYTIVNSWPSGYQVTVTVKNSSNTSTGSWVSFFQIPANQNISSFWNCVLTSSGTNITANNPSWIGGGTIGTNQSTTFGMIINKNSTDINMSLTNLRSFANYSNNIPIAPTLNAITTNATYNNYTVSWTSVSNATNYILQQDTTSAFSQPITILRSNVLSTVISSPDGTYYYRVAASNSSGTGPYSNIQSINVYQLTSSTLSPINNSSGSNNYVINWSAVNHATEYRLSQSTSSTLSNSTIIYDGTNLSYSVHSQTAGTYYYQVIAYSGTNHSPPSNIVNTTVTQNLPQKFIEAYWESWNSTDSVNDIVNMNSDIINISFANFQTTGTNTFVISGIQCSATTLSQLVSAAHALGKKVKLSIGGATYPIGSQLTSTIAASGLATAVANFVTSNNLDGVDYDIEDYPAYNLQIALLQYTRQLLGNKLISYTAKSPASTTAPYSEVIAGAYNIFDTVNIMAYDYGPGYSYTTDVQNLIEMGVPSTKIVIGLMPGYDDLGVLTNVTNISTACNYILSNNLAGVMFWDLNRDHENLTGLGVDVATNTAHSILG